VHERITYPNEHDGGDGAVRWYGLSVLMRHDLQVGYVVTEIPSNIALKHKQRNLELVALETEILFESIEPSLRDVDAVEE
jgi:hypothetical protein